MIEFVEEGKVEIIGMEYLGEGIRRIKVGWGEDRGKEEVKKKGSGR